LQWLDDRTYSCFLKTAKKEPVFSQSKVVFTIGPSVFKENWRRFLKKVNTPYNKRERLEPFKETNNTAIYRGGATYADAITFGAEKIEKKLLDEFTKVRGKKTLLYNAESDLTDYLQLYNDLAGK
jgi:starch synthase